MSGPRCPEQPSVVRYACGGAQVVGARGAFDLCSVSPLAEALERAAAEHSKVVLDASGITFADSSLLNLLILTHRTVDLRVAAPTRQLCRLLEITGVDTLLTVRSTVEEAAAC
ncbi:STAS domain-containing protein [Streptomyces sp. NPDC060311]|uniref:STAS domain-containing protein n=1 Tax=Streptomyces sp. NPDC060311 TaxID=3347096 RepID=UPI003650E5A4